MTGRGKPVAFLAVAEDDFVDGGPEPPRPGALRWFVGTTFRAFYRPTEFFRSLPADGGYGRPLVYALLMVWLVVLLGFADMLLRRGVSGVDRAYVLRVCLIPPVYAFAFVLAASAAIHVVGLIIRCSAGGYKSTFTACAYGSAGMVLIVLPIVGIYLSAVWCFIITVVGLRELHGSTTLRAALAVILAVVAAGFLLPALA